MNLSIMQPYIFPYLGYFHLIQATDSIVFYDDVNYIKGGWINRNRLLISGTPSFFTVPVIKASPNKKINEIYVSLSDKWVVKFLKSLRQSYGKSPFFEDVFPLVESVFFEQNVKLSSLAIDSISSVYKYLGIELNFVTSSGSFSDTQIFNGESRVLEIARKCKAKMYLNVSAGRHLYSHDSFSRQGIELRFLESDFPEYPQTVSSFVPGLSIVDILMNNSRDIVIDMFNDYRIVS
ncbi:WbqC family protein [Maridesulfovibrio salexigens]|uniref:WbqC-like family protein n=1 Tax=Maridesulfovibrio salexigens (strain ATCC 14822 / DSM 2638 / NCIMB 8403 / VKM B-1763) TaxID=526222 RepID=C6BTH3_MARSD|nr:WbqC family protein [Maridesulfovibrio salexigens]ACS81654.1 WbqC-like family protein [Maridesulfovibrio salexigens DSM 2638]